MGFSLRWLLLLHRTGLIVVATGWFALRHVESPQIRDRTCLSFIVRQIFFFFFFNHWAIREAPQRLFKCFVIYFLYLFLALLGLPCCAGSSLVVISRGCSWVAARGLLMAASLAAKHGLSGGRASILAARGLSAWGSRALEHRLSRLWGSGLASPWQVGSS